MPQVSFTRFYKPALAVTALFHIGALPSLTGVVILADMLNGGQSALTEPADAARRASYPLAIWWHILGGAAFVLLGLAQFSTRLRLRFPGFHRWSGRVLVAGGLGLALAGLWMNYHYPNPVDSFAHDLLQTLAALALIASIGLGLAAIRRRQIARHRAWMMRSYALCLGAGTQTLLILPLLLAGMMPPTPLLDTIFGLAWVLNLSVAEWLIRRSPPRRVTRSPGLGPKAAI